MSKSSIEWTDATWNPTTGCTHVSKECLNCYAEKETNRYMHNSKQPKYKAGFDVVVEHPFTLLEPLTWKKPRTVFVNSMSDLFHKDVSLTFIKQVFRVMNDTPQHTYQILTKRHELLKKYSDELIWTENIWMGVSVGMKVATRRIKALVNCGAKNKFLSIEPLIEDLGEYSLEGIDLVFVGGESGSNSVRPMQKEWVLNVLNKCERDNVVFFFKQWGKTRNNPNQNDPTIAKEHPFHAKGGCLLDGKLYIHNPSNTKKNVEILNLFEKEYIVVSNYDELKIIWELKTYLPLMEEDLFNQLKADIKTNGINDPILYFTTKDGSKLVIEGHTRLSAATSLKLKVIPTKEIKEDFNSIEDIKLWMLRHQFQRRNLSSVEKIQLAMLSKETIEKLAKENLSKAGKKEDNINPIDTDNEIAKLAGVGKASVSRYTSVLNKASKAVIQKLNKGELSIYAAYKTVEKKVVDTTVKKLSNNKSNDKKYLTINSFDDGKDKINSGLIDYFIVADEFKIEHIKNRLNKKVGVYVLNQ